MFTGLVEELGIISKITQTEIWIEASVVMKDLGIKDSISVNGACLTVVDLKENTFRVDVVPETLSRTDLGYLAIGDKVNLERSAQLGGRLGGHIVQGHVDGTAAITSIVEDGTSWSIEFQIPNTLSRYIVEKGFICVDGASLTVVNCDEKSFSIALIPYTKDNTVLGLKRVGSTVNIETDIIGKYLEKLSTGDQANIELD
ncbi:MAG: riboflavin synthase [SAR202 cluster bacterium]|jgi:riboflavin synthase|nr:MAG: riboflavin synthase [SAR202 cluster bacterium]KAA1302843.1 MAG: riboflavin synthase [SAR202 cluster bacterium]MAR85937.1 riboflavin synthase [Chloroflexota bacterium]MED6295881.1 riboflavin synthase [Chloroflexota bacterium]MEE3345526.1 riboflavin synthase [Chloroflexota bacterium]|tara:strand:- start:6337 stop:6936 length:600 start_codon:yes stop_codon:yes gene_type:complete